jgi:hypothetical protein
MEEGYWVTICVCPGWRKSQSSRMLRMDDKSVGKKMFSRRQRTSLSPNYMLAKIKPETFVSLGQVTNSAYYRPLAPWLDFGELAFQGGSSELCRWSIVSGAWS